MILPLQAFAPCGHVLKPHGARGAVKCTFSNFFTVNFTAGEWLFLAVHQKPVPFLISAITYPDDDLPVINFYEVTTPEAARYYKNAPVLYPVAKLDQQPDGEPDLIGLEGFRVYKADGQLQGYIKAVNEQADQLLLTIQSAADPEPFEAPCHPDLIAAFSREEQWLKLHLPDGLDEL